MYKLISAASALLLGALLVSPPPVLGSGEITLEVRFLGDRVEPPSLSVEAGRPVRLKVINAGPSAIEFESFELHRERTVGPGRAGTIYFPSLAPEVYHFHDDFNEKAGEGTLVAK